MDGIGTVQGGNTVLCDGKSRRQTVGGSETCWFPWNPESSSLLLPHKLTTPKISPRPFGTRPATTLITPSAEEYISPTPFKDNVVRGSTGAHGAFDLSTFLKTVNCDLLNFHHRQYSPSSTLYHIFANGQFS